MIYLISNQGSLFKDLSDDIRVGTIEQCYEYFSDKEFVAVDTETKGFDPYTCPVLSLQLGDYNTQFVVDCTTVDIKEFKSLLESKTLILQNAKFDLKFLYHHSIVPMKVYDTFLAEMVLFTGYRAGSVRMALDVLVDKYCDAKVDKGVRGQIHWRGLDSVVIKYGADDVKYLQRIMEAQLVEIEKKNLYKALALDNSFVLVLAYIEYCGIYLNIDKWKNKMHNDNIALKKAEDALNKWIIDHNMRSYIAQQLDLFNPEPSCSINWASSKQVIPLMQDLGINTKTKDKKTGEIKDSVESKVLSSQLDKSPLVSLYLTYKSAEKVVSTYGQNWLDQVNPITGRIHSNFRQIMNTGRMSCGGKDKARKVEYVNLQNLPADHTRKCFTNQYTNTTLVNADFSGQEAVVFANKCLDRNLLKFYDEGLGDMHGYVAKLCFSEELADTPLERVKEVRPDLRQLAKAAGFSIQFGGQGITIANNLNLSLERGEEVYNAYFTAFPDVDKYFETCKKDALEKGYIEFNNLSNRKSFIDFFDEFKRLEATINRSFWDNYRVHKRNQSDKYFSYYKPIVTKYFRMKGDIERRSLNYPVQGTSAEITKIAGIKFFNWVLANNLFGKVLISNIVHDEYLVECDIELANTVAKELQNCMEKAGSVFYTRVPLKATPVITNFWTH